MSVAVRERLRVAHYVVSGNPVNVIAFGLFAFLVLCAIAGPAIAKGRGRRKEIGRAHV